MQQKLASTQRFYKYSRKHTLSWQHLYTNSMNNTEKIYETQRKAKTEKHTQSDYISSKESKQSSFSNKE